MNGTEEPTGLSSEDGAGWIGAVVCHYFERFALRYEETGTDEDKDLMLKWLYLFVSINVARAQWGLERRTHELD